MGDSGFLSRMWEWPLFAELRHMDIRQLIYQVLNFAMIIATALMIWKGMMVVTGSESPVVVVLSGSMEPSFYRGDLLILGDNRDDPIKAGEIVVFRIRGRDIPVVHRVIRSFVETPAESHFLTKGDNNRIDDRGLYAEGQSYVHRSEIIGRARGLIPYIGMVTILLNDYPQLKYVVIVHLVCSTKIPSDVIDLSDRFLDAMDNGFWFVKFYAPWCVHCKRLAPIWEGVGHVLADHDTKIRVGKVDCTRFPIVASKLGVTGYPTLIFFRNGVQIPYDGERKKDSLVDFAKKTAGPVIAEITSKEEFIRLRKTAAKDPYFVYVVGSEGTSFNEFDSISAKLFTSTRFFRVNNRDFLANDIVLQPEADVLLFKGDKYKSFKALGPENLNAWIHRERWPLIPFISASNVYTISEDTQKKLVLTVIDLVDRFNLSTESGRFFKIVESAAATVEEDKNLGPLFQFGWLDGNSMANSVVMGQMNIPEIDRDEIFDDDEYSDEEDENNSYDIGNNSELENHEKAD